MRKLAFIPFFLIFLSLFIVVAFFDSPEETICGQWEEVDWKYEKVDNRPATMLSYKDLAEEAIIRHEAEFWEFNPDRTFRISRKDRSDIHGTFSLKGRGHLLKLVYEGGEKTEKYEVNELTNDEMVLIVTIDGFEVRGIAKLIFKRKE